MRILYWVSALTVCFCSGVVAVVFFPPEHNEWRLLAGAVVFALFFLALYLVRRWLDSRMVDE